MSAQNLPPRPARLTQRSDSGIEISHFMSGDGLLTKRAELRNGELHMESRPRLKSGMVERRALSEFADLEQLIRALGHNQALGLGVPVRDGPTFRIATKAHADANDPGCITRTKQEFQWPKGRGFVVFDYDAKGEGFTEVKDAEHYVSLLARLDPQFESAGWLRTHSTSAGIARVDTGALLTPTLGLHLWVEVKDFSALERYLETLYMLAVIEYGHALIGRDGTVHIRTIFDRSVFSPERLVFEAGASVGDGLVQNRPAPQLSRGNALDLTTLSRRHGLQAEFDTKVGAIRDSVRNKAAKVRAEYGDVETAKLLQHRGGDINKEQARKVVAARHRFELYADDVLHFDDGQRVTVSDVLGSPDAFANKSLRDPLEPEQGSGKAMLFVNGPGNITIHSFVHGGRNFKVSNQGAPVATIHLSGKLIDEKVKLFDTALAAPGPEIFQRGQCLVSVATGADAQKVPGLERPASSPAIVAVNPSMLRVRATQHIEFLTTDSNGKTHRVDCPPALATTLLNQKGWGSIRPVRGLATWPVFLLDGRLIMRDGYDRETGLFIDLNGLVMPDVPVTPSTDQITLAKQLLAYLFTDFPFVSEVDKAVAQAAIFSILLRPMLRTVPGIGIDAKTAGTGKSLLARCICILATGHTAPAMALSGKPEEDEKRISAAVMEGDAVVLLDNLSKPLSDDLLCVALTEPKAKLRPFGSNTERVEVDNTAVWMMTGNNLEFVGDITRRVLLCRLDADRERPEQRTDFKVPNLEHAVREQRANILWAAYVLLRAFIAAGKPSSSKKPLGSFEDWSRWVRDMLIFHGYADPVESQEEIRERDPVREDTSRLLKALATLAGGYEKDFRVSDVIDAVRAADGEGGSTHALPEGRERKDAAQTVREALGRNADSSQAVGTWLRSNNGRPTGGLKVSKSGTGHGGKSLWCVVEV